MGLNADVLIRSVLFVAVFLIVWVSLHPFSSLADPPSETTEAGNRANQIGFSLAFVVLATWAWFNECGRLKPLLRPALVVMFAWFVLTAVTSWDPGLSVRRFAFTLIVMALASIMLLLPKSLRHFADLLTVLAGIILAVCYLGVLLAPSVSVHQFTDFLEPEHAGSWRGLFAHKNQAGAIMVILVFIGLFVARVRSVAIGGAIVVLAGIFLVCSHSKTSIAMLPLVLLVSAVLVAVRQPLVQGVVAFGILLAINLFSVGAAIFPQVQSALELVIPDPTFTGRTDIWQFSLDQLARHPITGYGFSAFWGTEQVVYGLASGFTWATAATDAHNAYLNTALTTGLPGLLLAVLWIVILPLRDFQRLALDGPESALSILFLRVWLFGIYASSFESTLFQQVGEVWFILIVAVFGLRLLSTSRVTA